MYNVNVFSILSIIQGFMYISQTLPCKLTSPDGPSRYQVLGGHPKKRQSTYRYLCCVHQPVTSPTVV